MQKKASVIRHIAFEDLGSFDYVLKTKGYLVKYFEAGYDDLSDISNSQPEILIILGGPIGVYDQKDYPFLEKEISILKNRIEKDLPTLGICLGAQLIAATLGAQVYNGEKKEIGWSKLKLTEEGSKNYFKYLDGNLTKVLHWHGDTFKLPKYAVLQASSDMYINQAFTYGKNILALQFHIEVTELGMEKWFIGHANEISATSGICVSTLRSDTKKNIRQLNHNSKMFLEGWLHHLECK